MLTKTTSKYHLAACNTSAAKTVFRHFKTGQYTQGTPPTHIMTNLDRFYA